MASLERLPSGRWRVRWREGGRGAPWHKSPSVGTKAEAHAVRGKIEADLVARRAPREGIPESLGVIASAWINAKLVRGTDPDHTRRERIRLTTLLRRYGWTNVFDLTPAEVDLARARSKDDDGKALAWSPRAGALLASALRWAGERRGASVDHRTLVALRPGPPARHPPRPLASEAEAARWHKAAADQSPDAGALVHCLARYGWRPITAARLRVGNVDLARGVVLVAVKGGDTVEHPLMPDTVAMLAAVMQGREPTAPVFEDPRTGQAFALSGCHSIPQWWRDHIGGCGSYDAKRFAISRLLSVAQPHEVARITGHRTPSVLFRYALTNEAKSRAVLEKAWAHGGHTKKATPRPKRKAKHVKP